jgi:hypothetical protein
MIKTKGKKTSNKLDKDLWETFSEYIRRRDAKRFEALGYAPDRVKCFTCDYVGHWKYDMQAGHFMPRQHMGTKFDEKNVQSQCGGCNCFEQGNQLIFSRNLDKLYGKGTSEWLEQKAKSLCKWMNFEYEEKIIEYKQKIKDL